MSSSTAARHKLVHDYDLRFVVCRQGQHRWPPFSQWNWHVTLGLKRRPIEYRLYLTCEVCGTTAVDKIDAHTGEKTRSYRWPEGYRIPIDAEVSRTDLRLEMLGRLASEAEVDEPVQKKSARAS